MREFAIKFKNESKANIVNGASCPISCSYIPEIDTYLSVESNNDISTGRVAIYNDFLKKIIRGKVKENSYTEYRFYQTEPDNTVSDFFGSFKYNGYIKYIQKSNNGRWIVFNYIDTGLFRMDMKTGQVLKFSSWYTSPGSALEFDITDDGSRVAVMGQNAPGLVFEINDSCGLILPSMPSESDLYQSQSTECGSRDIIGLQDSYLQSARSIHQPVFRKNGNQLSFYARPYSQDGSIVSVTMSINGDMSLSDLSYLALGDSYSSGEGDTELINDTKSYRVNTDVAGSSSQPREKCHISTRSYPYILANGMALGGALATSLTKWQSVACSGATVWDVTSQASSIYEGQGKRLLGIDQNSLKTQALNTFIPGRQKQIEFVRTYQPSAITLTMGGNDIGFAEKMRACTLSYGTCDPATPVGAARFAKQIKDQYEVLKSLYEELYNASGRISKIYVIGYPQFINGNKNNNCGDMNIGMINGKEREAIGKAVTFLNNVIEQAARAAGVKYIDIENSLNGHRLCDNHKKYVTGLAAISPSEVQESFHPNAKGHYEMAMAIWENVENKSLLDYSWCNENTKNCPEDSSTKDTIQEVPSFPISDQLGYINYVQMTSRFVKKDSVVTLKIPENSMNPGVPAVVTLRETGKELVRPVIADDGSLTVDITIPDETPVGPHTLEVVGETYSGEPITNEQVIEVHGPDEGDIDEDGVDDVNDSCLFIAPINRDQDSDGIDDACDAEITENPASPSPSPSSSPTPSVSPSPSVSPEPTPTSSPSPSPSPTPTPTPTPTPSNPVAVSFLSFLKKVIVAIVKTVLYIVSLVIK